MISQKNKIELQKLNKPLNGRELNLILQVASSGFNDSDYISQQQPDLTDYAIQAVRDNIAHWLSLYMDVSHFIDAVRRTDDRVYHEVYAPGSDAKHCSFHISCCPRCDTPVWMQPCPFCDYYPMTNHDLLLTPTLKARFNVSFEHFQGTVERAGNYATFYWNSHKQTVAYGKQQRYRDYVEKLLELADNVDEPSAHVIWATTKFYRSVSA